MARPAYTCRCVGGHPRSGLDGLLGGLISLVAVTAAGVASFTAPDICNRRTALLITALLGMVLSGNLNARHPFLGLGA